MHRLIAFLLAISLTGAAAQAQTFAGNPRFQSVLLSGQLGLGNWASGGRPASPPTGSFGFNTTTLSPEFYNGTSWAPIAGSGSVTSIGCGSGLNGGTITTSGSCSVNSGTGPNQIVQLDGNSLLPPVDGSALVNLNASAIASGTLSPLFGGTGLGAFTPSGNTTKFVSTTGTLTNGHCVSIDVSGNMIDAGGACTTGGASGTVASATINAIAAYSGATTVAGLAIVNNAVLVTNGSGVPSESVTLPTGLTIPGAVLTGTATAVNETFSGILTTAASTTGGSNLIITPGTAPTSPTNGMIWMPTGGGLAYRNNGVTVAVGAGSGTVTSLTGTTPIVLSPSTITSTGAITCPNCLTTTSGGALTVSSPLSLTNSALSISQLMHPATLFWPANVTVSNDTYPIIPSSPYAGSVTLQSLTYSTGGTTPSFTIGVFINGVAVTGCSGITVTSATSNTATCTAANVATTGQAVTVVVSGVSGTPSETTAQVTFLASAI